MDQDNSKGQDKRNWRERLGIGAQGGKDLPKISDDFRKEPQPAAERPVASQRPVASARPAPPRAAAPAVKPAPMAPRANPKPVAQPPISPDKLAERLRSQREASTKLAEQRVQVAKQRAESQVVAPPPPQPQQPVRPQVPPAAKPKFTFAEETNGAASAPQVAAPAPRSMAPMQQPTTPQMAPARPPLGGQQLGAPPAFQQRPQSPQYPPQQPQFQPQQQPQAPLGYQPQYQQQPVPPYRPIDPNSGYAPPPGYVPQQRGFAPQPGQFTPPQQNGPRLNMPQRGAPAFNPNFQQPPQDFGAPQQQAGFGGVPPRVARPQMRTPAPLPQAEEEQYEEDFDEQRVELGNRRPSTNDYQQAYREAEFGYDDEAPRSKLPWILGGLLFLTLAVAALGVVWYLSSGKQILSGQPTNEQVPAVAAPDTPAKVPAEPAAAVENNTRSLDTTSKKKIYDRIVGDQEVLGGEVAPAIETPAAIPEPVPEAAPADPAAAVPAEPAGSGNEDAAPLPIPPPPGANGEQQGSIAPDIGAEANGKQSAENISPAAGESQAAVAASGVANAPAEQPSAAPTAVADAPVPGELQQVATAPAEAEAIEDPKPAPITKKKPIAEKPKAEEPKRTATRSLGAKPVVLVAPVKKARSETKKAKLQNSVQSEIAADRTDDAGLYGAELTTANTDVAPPVATTAPKKKKTLADLFRGEDTQPAAPAEVATTQEPEVAALVKPAVKKPQVQEQQQASLGSGFSVQLASFRSRNEATTEFARLKAKHSGTLSRFSPVISEAEVGGSTRYRLSVAGMSSLAQANAVCSSLFAGGERDCLVKKQ